MSGLSRLLPWDTDRNPGNRRYYMNDEIRERLQSKLRCRDQEWLDTYCREHEAAFGEGFVIN